MLELDGSDGGGQMLRTALGLSVVTGTPFCMKNIRAKRKNAGLAEQHMQAVKAVQSVCNAEVSGNKIGSKELTFIPKEIVKSRNVSVTIGTAGSVGLVLQPLLIVGVVEDLTINVFGGGTYTAWSVPVDQLTQVLAPLLAKAKYHVSITTEKEGFYPKGGAFVQVKTTHAQLDPLVLVRPKNIRKVTGVSVASLDLEAQKVAGRQAEAVRHLLKDMYVEIEQKYVRALSAGSGIALVAENGVGLIGGDSLGEKSKRAEVVGEEAAIRLLEATKGAVDKYTADQLLPFMALAGSGEILAAEITDHIYTNIKVIEEFLPVQFEIKGRLITCKAKR